MRIHRSFAVALLLLSASAVQAASFSYSGTVVQFVAPNTGTFDITAVGAAGGPGDSGITANNTGGLGASVTARFSLTSGQTLDILVGQRGSAGDSGGGGGGGGTYVVIHGGAALLVAGGGGGGGGDFFGGSGQSASALTLQSSGGGNGGTSTFDSNNGTGAGGGGLTGNGANGADPVFNTPIGGKSYQNGGAGGASSNITVAGYGGFGGGGGGSDVGAGGGGGYTGGNGGGSSAPDGGGAGSSFANLGVGSVELYTAAGSSADGLVTIVEAPEPGAVVSVLLCTGALALKRRGRLKHTRAQRPGLMAPGKFQAGSSGPGSASFRARHLKSCTPS